MPPRYRLRSCARGCGRFARNITFADWKCSVLPRSGQTSSSSDVDLLVTLADSASVSTAELLEMAGEAEELVGRRVDFVLRHSLEKSPNRFAREHILATAVCLYGN